MNYLTKLWYFGIPMNCIVLGIVMNYLTKFKYSERYIYIYIYIYILFLYTLFYHKLINW